jgi:CheY-like chemotaxis protein
MSKPLNILVLEDDDAQRALICELLIDHEHHVHGVAHADDAILLGKDGFIPDLLISDIRLQGALDGYDVALYWRSKVPKLPVLYLTANRDADIERQMPGSGYLRKPFQSACLIEEIERLAGTVHTSGASS